LNAADRHWYCQNSWLVVVENLGLCLDNHHCICGNQCAFLLSGGIDTAWGLLADGHAELLNVCKLALNCNQAVGLDLRCFLCGCIGGAQVHKQVTV
jgi:hypothetical protein